MTQLYPYVIPFVYVSMIHFAGKHYKYINVSNQFKLIYNSSLSAVSLFLFLKTIFNIDAPLYDLICFNSSDQLSQVSYSFYILKFIEWFDSVLLVIKYKGNVSKISNLHYIHHAIVPTMTFYGMGQPGEIYVLLTNNLAHFLMYGYYSYPTTLSKFKKYITQYQYVQHLGAVMLIFYQYVYGCNISYPLINVFGYCYFFYEYLNLIPQINTNTKSSFIFATNVIHLINAQDLVYLYSWVLLFFSSVIYHQTHNKYLQVIDKFLVYNIILQGGIRLVSQSVDVYSILCFGCFVVVILLYHIENNYCLNRNYQEYYHSFLHLLSSIGHHIIITKSITR